MSSAETGADSRPGEGPQTILVGLSGPSSSGKTTLARLLRSIFNVDPPADGGGKLSLFILHQDDFYKTDVDVPIKTFSSTAHGSRDLQDWDCVESLDLALFRRTLAHIRAHGAPPPDMLSKEDQNSVGASGVADAEVARLQSEVAAWWRRRASGRGDVRICVMDGFLLYPAASSAGTMLGELQALTAEMLAPRLFLPATREQMLQRRAGRSGYVTLEGFWTDPPGYVEDVVWPNYAADHGWMYVGGDAEGTIDIDKAAAGGITVAPGNGSWEMGRLLEWGVERLRESVESKVA